ncbi:MAG: hypothetical protein KGZ34_07575 [Nitrosarchaeum sp.]|nr:hypothetical protein [Nitrosarchaeum sp.]
MMIIEPVILLQINATIIAGAIILLTITSFVSRDSHEPIGISLGKGRGIAFTPHQVSAGTIGSFGISSLSILGNSLDFAYLTAGVGFVWLIVCAIVIGGKEQFDNFKKNG